MENFPYHNHFNLFRDYAKHNTFMRTKLVSCSLGKLQIEHILYFFFGRDMWHVGPEFPDQG